MEENSPATAPVTPVETIASSSEEMAESVASIKTVELPAGAYQITVVDGLADRPRPDEWSPAAVMVSPAPVGSSKGFMEFHPGPGTHDRWLRCRDDSVIVKVHGGATLLLTSVRAPDAPPMSIDVRYIAPEQLPDHLPNSNWIGEEQGAPLVPLDLIAHIQRVGDVQFLQGTAAGPDGGQWIEGFSIALQSDTAAQIIEYSAVDVSGTVTPWLECGAFCGSRGRGLALTGFALRIKPHYVHAYECSYGARFSSGRSSSSLHDGTMCQSDLARDPIMAMEVRLFATRADG
jgi:hypothetical protein